MDEMMQTDAEWIAEFTTKNRADIWARAANPHDPSRRPQCFGVGQHAAVCADGTLLYHEGHASDKITHARLRHAWNTFQGQIVDLSQNTLPDSGPFDFVPAEDVYENYESEHSYTVEQVEAKLKARTGGLDWFDRPEYPDTPA